MTTHYSFNQPVTSPQYTHLRQPHWQSDLNISLVDNVLAFSAQLNATLPSVTGATAAVLTYTSAISGSYTNLDEGMVCIVSPTSDPRYPTAIRLRVRYDGSAGKVADATHVYVSEYSDILGLGSYIFVYYAYDLIDSLSRPVGTNPVVQYEDYNQPFTTMAPVIRGPDTIPLQLAYADWVDSAGHYDIAFDVTGSFSPQSGASLSSYQWSVVPTGSGVATVIAGSTATAQVTYQFTAGEYWVKIVVTDSLGVTWFRHVLVKAHSDSYPPQEGFEGVEITRDIAQGPSARVKFYDNVASLINGTLAVFWMKELYSNEDFSSSSSSLFGNIACVGWIETEENQFVTDPTYSAYSEVQFEVQGVGARLSRIEGQMLTFQNASSPSAWDQIKNLTPWRAVVHYLQHHTQALHLCDFTADDLTDTFLFPTISAIGGNGLDNVSGQQGIAMQVRSALAFARDGRILMETRADFDPTYSADLTHVATWLDEDTCGQVSLKINQYVQYGFINADGACWDGTSATPIPFLSRAPGLAQSSGSEQGQFNNQILTSGKIPAAAQAELNQYSGTQFAIDNNTTELRVTHPDSYWWMETSLSQLYIFDFTFAVRGITLDGNTYWMIKNVTQQFDNKAGAGPVQVTYIPVVAGGPGVTVPIINNTSLTPPVALPPMPAFNFELPEATIPDSGLTTSPTTPPTTDRTGEIVLEVNSSGQALSIAQNYILLAAPTWRNYTPVPLPSGYTLVDACFDQLGSTGGAVAVYALANNGTNSIIFYNANVLNGTSAWSQTGTPYSGVHTSIRVSSTLGGVETYAPAAFSAGHATITVASGSVSTTTPNFGDPFTVTPVFNSSFGGFYSFSIHFDACYTAQWVARSLVARVQDTVRLFFNDCGGPQFIAGIDDGHPFSDFAGLAAINTHLGQAYPADQIDMQDGGSADFTFILTDPSGNATVRYSSDYGATVGAAVTVGATPGSKGGFDLIRNGGVSYAAASAAVYKASSLGGAYSSFASSLGGNPLSMAIPYYQIGSDSVSQVSSSSPQVVIGLDTEVSGSCLYYLNGSGTPTKITTPASGATILGANKITLLRGTKMAVIVNVGAFTKLYVTQNLAADGSATWTFVQNVSPTATLRSRRNDPRTGANHGQLYLFDTPSGYSSRWASASEFSRISPAATVLAGDILG